MRQHCQAGGSVDLWSYTQVDVPGSRPAAGRQFCQLYQHLIPYRSIYVVQSEIGDIHRENFGHGVFGLPNLTVHAQKDHG